MTPNVENHPCRFLQPFQFGKAVCEQMIVIYGADHRL